MPKFRPLLFSYRYSEKPFRGKHWYVSGFKQGRRVQQWCRSEKEARTRVKHFNDEIEPHGRHVSLSPASRIQAIEAQERLAFGVAGWVEALVGEEFEAEGRVGHAGQRAAEAGAA